MAKNSVWKNITIIILVLIVLALLARYVVFHKQFEELRAGVQRIAEWQEDLKAENQNVTKDQMDSVFKVGIGGLEAWKAQYRKDHPDATEVEISAAFDAAWANK